MTEHTDAAINTDAAANAAGAVSATFWLQPMTTGGN